MLHNHHGSVYIRIRDTQSALLSSGNASVCTMTQVGVCQSCAQPLRHEVYEADLVLHRHRESVASGIVDTRPALPISASAMVYTLAQAGVC